MVGASSDPAWRDGGEGAYGLWGEHTFILISAQIFLETPRARVTLLLSHHHESLAEGPPSSATYKENMQTACELLSDLQVETYSSMDRREKTEFILEQMRLLIAVARLKDAELDKNGKEVLGGGESEWVKVRVGGRKINEEFLKEKDNEVRASAIAFSMIASSQPPGSQTEVL
jgi:26S proteasome regulatory subunit N5